MAESVTEPEPAPAGSVPELTLLTVSVVLAEETFIGLKSSDCLAGLFCPSDKDSR